MAARSSAAPPPLPGDERLVELGAEDALDLRPVGRARPRLGARRRAARAPSGSSRCALTAAGSLSGCASPARRPRGERALRRRRCANHFMNVIALSLLGADAGTPWMKMPIWAIAFVLLGTTPKSSLPTTLDCAGSSDLIALPEYWMIAPASPPRIAAPSWSESNSATPGGAIDFSVPTKKSAAALPCGGVERDVPLVVEELAAEATGRSGTRR